MLSHKNLKLVGVGILIGLLFLIVMRSRVVRGILLFCTAIVLAGVFGGAIGAIAGLTIVMLVSSATVVYLWLKQLGSKFIPTWQNKPVAAAGTDSFRSQSPSVSARLRAGSGYSHDERLILINELENVIRAKSPNFSDRDLQDLSLLGRERQQAIDEVNWTQIRRSRVDRIADIRSSRQANQQFIPSGLDTPESELELTTPIYSDIDYYGILDDDEHGIGDLTCSYNARSLFLRCAVNPSAETCEGCRDYCTDSQN